MPTCRESRRPDLLKFVCVCEQGKSDSHRFTYAEEKKACKNPSNKQVVQHPPFISSTSPTSTSHHRSGHLYTPHNIYSGHGRGFHQQNRANKAPDTKSIGFHSCNASNSALEHAHTSDLGSVFFVFTSFAFPDRDVETNRRDHVGTPALLRTFTALALSLDRNHLRSQLEVVPFTFPF